MKSELKTLQEIHTKMDEMNPIYAKKDEICIYCCANEYDGKVGIIHYMGCPIITIRSLIALKQRKVKDE